MKKDEDADQGMIKLDRTTVFQEGKLGFKQWAESTSIGVYLTISFYSAIIQFVTDLAPKMSYTTHEACCSPVHG